MMCGFVYKEQKDWFHFGVYAGNDLVTELARSRLVGLRRGLCTTSDQTELSWLTAKEDIHSCLCFSFIHHMSGLGQWRIIGSLISVYICSSCQMFKCLIHELDIYYYYSIYYCAVVWIPAGQSIKVWIYPDLVASAYDNDWDQWC